MNTMNRRTSVMATALTAAFVLVGCSYPGSDADRAAFWNSGQHEAPTSPDQSPPNEDDDQPQKTDGDKGIVDKVKEKAAEKISLKPETGTMYLRAAEGFSPKLERWVVDLDAGDASYTRYTCTGSIDGIGTGALTADGDYWELTWDADSPLIYSQSPRESLTITDRRLEQSINWASAKTDAELQKYLGLCRDAGEMVAGFALG